MRKRFVTLVCLAGLMASISGCYTITHTVGRGAQGDTEVAVRDWYFLWGFAPVNSTNSHKLAAGSKDYTVVTQWTPIDFVINFFTMWISLTSRTITVTK